MTFNQAIERLNTMRRNNEHIAETFKNGNKRYTPEYLEALELASKLNKGTTPIGFYLD